MVTLCSYEWTRLCVPPPQFCHPTVELPPIYWSPTASPQHDRIPDAYFPQHEWEAKVLEAQDQLAHSQEEALELRARCNDLEQQQESAQSRIASLETALHQCQQQLTESVQHAETAQRESTEHQQTIKMLEVRLKAEAQAAREAQHRHERLQNEFRDRVQAHEQLVARHADLQTLTATHAMEQVAWSTERQQLLERCNATVAEYKDRLKQQQKQHRAAQDALKKAHAMEVEGVKKKQDSANLLSALSSAPVRAVVDVEAYQSQIAELKAMLKLSQQETQEYYKALIGVQFDWRRAQASDPEDLLCEPDSLRSHLHRVLVEHFTMKLECYNAGAYLAVAKTRDRRQQLEISVLRDQLRRCSPELVDTVNIILEREHAAPVEKLSLRLIELTECLESIKLVERQQRVVLKFIHKYLESVVDVNKNRAELITYNKMYQAIMQVRGPTPSTAEHQVQSQ